MPRLHKQRERGGSYFAFPLAMAALSSVLGLSSQIFQTTMSNDLYACGFDRIAPVMGVVLTCLTIFSLSSFMLGWLRAAALASHGIGRSLHEEPSELSTWPDKSERRIIAVRSA